MPQCDGRYFLPFFLSFLSFFLSFFFAMVASFPRVLLNGSRRIVVNVLLTIQATFR